MSDLTILVTENPLLAGIPAALRDWSAAGLIRTFVWVPSLASPGGRGIEARLIEGGDVTVTSIGDLLARRSPDHVRIIALTSDITPGGESTALAERVLAGVRGAGGAIRTTAIQLLVTRIGARTGQLNGIVGWHNVVISPDDAAGPSRPHTTLDGPATDEDLARYALPAVAVVGALFDTVQAAPFDDVPAPPSGEFRVLRAFARRLDGDTVGQALQMQVLEMTRGYPLVVMEGGTTRATYVEDVDRANLDMAKSLWALHADVLMSGRRNPALAPVEDLSLWKAFKMLWGFLWAALKNAPADWAKKVIYSGKSWVANAATAAIFGQNSAFSVVVGGVRGAPGDSSWQTQLRALGALENSLGRDDEGHQVHARLDSLWKDLISGGLTLLDGGESRHAEMPAARIGSEIGILRFGTMLAPSKVSQSFTDIPGPVRAATGTASLAPYDTLSIRRFHQRLRQIQADPTAGVDAKSTEEKFQEWWRGVGSTFTAKVALRVSDAFEQRLQEILENTQILQAAGSASDLPAEIEKEQRGLARRLRWLLVGLILLVGATVALGVLALIAWLIASIMLTVFVLAWLMGSVVTFMRGQQRLFQLKNQRAVALGRAEAAEYNIAAAIRDARRCGDAYGLLQFWAEALAVFAGDPLGRRGAEEARSEGPDSDHSLAVQFGRAEVDDVEVARTANGIRRVVFPAGWLDRIWKTFLDGASGLLGVRGTSLLDDSDLMYRQRAVQEDDLLPAWATELEKRGVPGVAGQQVWDGIVTGLQTTARVQLDGLLGRVSTEAEGVTVPLRDFLGGLTAEVENPTAFPTGIFSASAVINNLARPVATWCQERAEGLSRTVVLTQISDAMPSEFLRPERGRELFDSNVPEPPRADPFNGVF